MRTLSACVADISSWMSSNRLKLNEEKTEFLVVGSPHNLRGLGDVSIDLGTSHVSPSTSIKNLGVYLDSNMSMSQQIDCLGKSVRFHLRNISRIRKYITVDACHHAVRSHVLSRIDYCNSLLTEVPQAHIRRLQSLQNWAARIIYRLDRRHDAMPLMRSLHWLPVKQRILYKILLFVYKSFHDEVPEYIKGTLQVYHPVRQNLRSSKDPFQLCYPVSRGRAGDRTFTIAAAKEWNKLPILVKSATSSDRFKKLLKTYLYPK